MKKYKFKTIKLSIPKNIFLLYVIQYTSGIDTDIEMNIF